ncbi:MAG: DUF1801 domain-containing protein [Bacteroidales bacterium]
MNPHDEVSVFLDGLQHPFRSEIDLMRTILLSANPSLKENIKWNGPNYQVAGEDRISMRIQPMRKQLQLIFHRGAKKQEQPKHKLISNPSTLLDWKENDRAIVTIKSRDDIEHAKDEIVRIVNEWIRATCE